MGRSLVPATKPVAYIRADLSDALLNHVDENTLRYFEETSVQIGKMRELLVRARNRLDAFADADLMDEINSALVP